MTCQNCTHHQENNYCKEYGKFTKPTSKECWYYHCRLFDELDKLKNEMDNGEYVKL